MICCYFSEAKGSFALVTSPTGDSVESSGRPGAPPAYEPNSADNLMLFDGEKDLKGETNSIHSSRCNVGPSEHSSQLVESQIVKGSGDSAAFGLPRKAYKRRNRSRPSRDGARSSSTDVVPSHGGNASSLPSRHVPRDTKGLTLDTDNQKDNNVSSNSNSKPTSPNYSMAPKVESSDRRLDSELDDVKADANVPNNSHDDQPNQLLESDAQKGIIYMTPANPKPHEEREETAILGCAPSPAMAKVDDSVASTQMNGFSGARGDSVNILSEVQEKEIVLHTNGLDSESCLRQTSPIGDGHIGSEICANLVNGGSDTNTKEETVALEETTNMVGNRSVEATNETKADGFCSVIEDDNNSFHKRHQESHQESHFNMIDEEPLKDVSASLIETKDCRAVEVMEPDELTSNEKERKQSNLLGSNSSLVNENECVGGRQSLMDSSIPENPETTLPARVNAVSPGPPTSSQVNMELVTKVHEDSILEEARVIEVSTLWLSILIIFVLMSLSFHPILSM